MSIALGNWNCVVQKEKWGVALLRRLSLLQHSDHEGRISPPAQQ